MIGFTCLNDMESIIERSMNQLKGKILSVEQVITILEQLVIIASVDINMSNEQE